MMAFRAVGRTPGGSWRHWKPIQLLSIVLLFGITACSSSPIVAASSSCMAPEREIDVREVGVESNGFEQDLALQPLSGDSLNPMLAYALSGNCLDLVIGQDWPLVWLKNDTTLSWTGAGFAAYPDVPPHEYFMALKSGTDLPKWGSREFRGASVITYANKSDGMYVYYLGIWRESGRDLIASFFRAPSEKYSTPIVLVTSKSPVRSVSYAPGPGAPAGKVGLTLETRLGLVLHTLHWIHPQLFE